MQVFFSQEHDLKKIPSKDKIDNLKEETRRFRCEIKLTDGNVMVHSYENPYPPLNNLQNLQDSKKQEQRRNFIEKMTCFVTRATLDDENTLIGYPLDLQFEDYDDDDDTFICSPDLNNICISPLFDPLSLEGFLMMQQQNEVRTASGKRFNYWLPLFINEKHYQRNRREFYNCLNIFAGLKFGIRGLGAKLCMPCKPIFPDYDPEFILSFFLKLLTQKTYEINESSIFGIKQIIRLFLRILQDCPDLYKIMDEKVEKAMLREENTTFIVFS